uniref:Putative capsid protein n=1 Tax=viral metagenome TaxID=1070528 RepID=A0A6H1ZPV3_9ZZZZ
MAMYNSGSVKIKVGSSIIRGNNTSFSTYAAAGYIFKRTNEAPTYEIAAINSATSLTLTARYADATNRTSRTAEHLATAGVATKMYSGTLNYNPVIQSYVVINASIETLTDNSAGVLTGDGTPAGSGTIDYDTGVWAFTLGTDLTATASFVASYFSGDTLNSIQYQIVRDYTSYKSLPEMSTNDVNFPHIYTKAVRMMDKYLYNASINNASITNLYLSGINRKKVTYKTTSYVATPADNTIVVMGNATAISITIPYSNTTNLGAEIAIINNSAYTVCATCPGSNTINGAVSTLLSNQYDKISIQSVATNLWIKI